MFFQYFKLNQCYLNVQSLQQKYSNAPKKISVNFVYRKWRNIFETLNIDEPKESISNIINHALNSRKVGPKIFAHNFVDIFYENFVKS